MTNDIVLALKTLGFTNIKGNYFRRANTHGSYVERVWVSDADMHAEVRAIGRNRRYNDISRESGIKTIALLMDFFNAARGAYAKQKRQG